MQTALHQHARTAHLNGLSDLLIDRFKIEDVAFGSHLALQWTVESAEGAVFGAEIGVVDVAVDDVGHYAFRMQLPAHGVGFHAQTNEVVGAEIIESLLARDRHTLILSAST